jgi:hypothetical protein
MSTHDTLVISPIRADKAAGVDEKGCPEGYVWNATFGPGTERRTLACRNYAGCVGLQVRYPDETEWTTISPNLPWLRDLDAPQRRSAVLNMFREAIDYLG